MIVVSYYVKNENRTFWNPPQWVHTKFTTCNRVKKWTAANSEQERNSMGKKEVVVQNPYKIQYKKKIKEDKKVIDEVPPSQPSVLDSTTNRISSFGMSTSIKKGRNNVNQV